MAVDVLGWKPATPTTVVEWSRGVGFLQRFWCRDKECKDEGRWHTYVFLC